MRKQVIFITTVFCFQFFASQRNEPKMFFGFPSEKISLISRDVIITNLPEINYNRGIFFYQNNLILDQLLALLQSNKNKIFEIELNKCFIKGNKKANEGFNKHLSLSIQNFLIKNDVSNGIVDISKFENCAGNLISSKDDKYYGSSGNYLSITIR